MASTRGDYDVTITLQARNPTAHFVEPLRQITLTSQKSSLHIGRASKVPAKGFVPAMDNAWFDSPVMSREHAELIASFPDKAVFVKDIGSLHGTFLKRRNAEKEERLLQNDQIRLEQDDSLRFGIDIIRSHENYPPCIVDVKMEWAHPVSDVPVASTNHFAAPDPDVEELPSDQDDCVETLSQKVQKKVPDAIDLTQDVSYSLPGPVHTTPPNMTEEVMSESKVIDLTSEPEVPEVSMLHTVRKTSRHLSGQAGSHKVEAVSDRSPSSSPTGSADREGSELPEDEQAALEDESSCFRHFSSRTSTIQPTIGGAIPLPTSWKVESDSTPGSASEDSDSDHDVPSEPHQTMSDWDAHSAISIIPGESVLSEEPVIDTNDDSQDDSDSDSNHTGSDIDEDALSNDDGELPTDYSESGDELQETNLFDQPSSPITDSPTSSPLVPTVKFDTAGSLSTPPHTKLQALGHQSVSSPSLGCSVVNYGSFSGPGQHLDARQSSPSNVAMFKSDGLKYNDSVGPSLGEQHPDRFEYFAAREHNRSVLLGKLSSPPVSALRETLAKMSSGNPSTPSTSHPFEVKPSQSTTHPPIGLSDLRVPRDPPFPLPPKPAVSTWATTGASFINNPQSFDSPCSASTQRTRLHSPELDMTSAYAFEESKKAKTSDKGIKRLAVQDICNKETSPGPSTLGANSVEPRKAELRAMDAPHREIPNIKANPATKRLFEESSTIPDESKQNKEAAVPSTHRRILVPVPPSRRLSSRLSKPTLSPTSAAPKATPTTPTTIIPPTTAVGLTAPISVELQEGRPKKRRRFAQLAACALGTALGGAAVFAGMLASAPPASFMLEHS